MRSVASGDYGEHPGQADARRHRGRTGPSGGTPTASTASTRRRRVTRCSPSTRRRSRSAGRCTWATCSATPTPTSIARYQRMAGKVVFYPMGWDDNGLPTERRVQNFYGVRCDPSQPYEEGFEPPFRGDPPKKHQRRADLASELPRAVRRTRRGRRGGLRAQWRRLGLSRRLDPGLRDDRRALAAGEPAGVPAQRRARRGVQPGGADDVGHRLPHRGRPGRDGRPRAAGRVPQDRVPASRRRRRRRDRHDPPRAARGVRGDGRPPRRRALTSRCSARR